MAEPIEREWLSAPQEGSVTLNLTGMTIISPNLNIEVMRMTDFISTFADSIAASG